MKIKCANRGVRRIFRPSLGMEKPVDFNRQGHATVTAEIGKALVGFDPNTYSEIGAPRSKPAAGDTEDAKVGDDDG